MISLLYCGNSDVFDGAMLSIMSAAKNASCALDVYIMTMDLTSIDSKFTPITSEQVSFLNELAKEYNSSNKVELIDATNEFLEEMSGCPNMMSGYTPYSLLRLLADRFDLPEKILYVDCDTMFNGDIAEISSYDIDGYEFAGALDHLGKHFIAKDYINAGVLYLNMKVIKETQLLASARKLCMRKTMPFPDQDSLNELATKKLIIPSRFNQQDKLKRDTVIQHFSKTIRFFPYFKIINVKPWQLELVREELEIEEYNDIFEEYVHRRDAISGILVPQRQSYAAQSPIKKFRRDIKEVISYAGQNGGIFRKQERVSASNDK